MERKVLRFASAQLKCSENDLIAEPVENEFFHRWKFWRVADSSLPPLVIYVASDGQVVQKISFDSGLAEQVVSEPVDLQKPEKAIKYIEFFISITNPYMIIVNVVDDIPGIDKDARKIWAERIKAPKAWADDKNYVAEFWMWENEELYQGKFIVEASGVIQHKVSKVADNIGVSIGLE